MRVSAIPLSALILGLPALCAGFMLPPALELTDSELAAFLEVPNSTPGSTALTVPCTGCTWHKDASDEEGVPYQAGLESDLVFDITLPTDRSLKINNIDILPFGPEISLNALQVPSKASSADIFFIDHSFRALKLGYDLLVTGTLVPDTATKEITIHLRITSVDGVHNDAIEEIQVIVNENTSTGTLELVSATKKPLEGPKVIAPPVVEDEVACQSIDCVFDKFRQRIDKFRLTHTKTGGKKGCHNKTSPSHRGGEHRGGPHRGGPHRGGPHRHHRPHNGHHGHHRGHFLVTLVAQVLVPIFIGIMAGVCVSLMGLIVGQGLIKLYQVVVKRRSSGSDEGHDDGECDCADEEKGLLKGMEVLEEVEGPPAYVEEGIEVVEKE